MKLRSKLNRKDFQQTIDSQKTDLYILRNKNGLEISVTNFGGRIVEIFTPDRNGKFADIVLGCPTVADYAKPTGERFFGAAIGRYGNRIANGRFKIGTKSYKLPQNNGKNCLHGGVKSLDMKVWKAVQTSQSSLALSCFSKDGEEGFPGDLSVFMNYVLTDDNRLVITYAASTTKATPVNLTHHSFFNLDGAGAKSIADHTIQINADYYTPVDANLIPTGQLESVKKTPFDFTKPHAIGERADADFGQIALGHGYDHNFVLNRRTQTESEFAARVVSPKSGRTLEVYTTEPGMQFYGGNFLSGQKGKNNKTYAHRSAFALETQHFPDSPNKPQFPSTILSPEDCYLQICEYRFGTDKSKK